MSHNTIHSRRAGDFANRFSPIAGRLKAHPAICGRGAGNGSRFSCVVFVDFAEGILYTVRHGLAIWIGGIIRITQDVPNRKIRKNNR